MLLDYHAMTMNEPRDSPARKQQYLVICTIMVGAFFYSCLNAGAFDPINIVTAKNDFPGGTFYYQNQVRDYAATRGLWDTMGTTFNISRDDYPDMVYALYLDDPWEVNGRYQRFATGMLFPKQVKEKKEKMKYYQDLAIKEMKKSSGNKKIIEKTFRENEEEIEWQSMELSSIPATSKNDNNIYMTQYPNTGGFVSAILISYRVIPALMKKASSSNENENNAVVFMTCDIRKLHMCTFYSIPTGDKNNNKVEKQYYLNQPNTKVYQKELLEDDTTVHGSVDWDGVKNDLRTVLTLPYTLLFGKSKKVDNNKSDGEL